ncbi:TPA: hypothetical protein I7659_11865 [Vibrio vulnificus]|nr:hypothetical protein [Vibrio vulnificus]
MFHRLLFYSFTLLLFYSFTLLLFYSLTLLLAYSLTRLLAYSLTRFSASIARGCARWINSISTHYQRIINFPLNRKLMCLRANERAG